MKEETIKRKRISERVKLARYHSGMSATEAAQILGIHLHTLYTYENGKAEVKPHMVMAMEQLYKTKISED